MRSRVFDQFELIRIINLPARTDRRKEMEAQLARMGLRADVDERLAFFPAILVDAPGPFMNNGTHGCFLSHLAIIKRAAALGRSILIIEDDCDFLDSIVEYKVPPDVDVFYGGYSALDPANLEESDIIGAHFMGFSAKAVLLLAEYLNSMLKPGFAPDALAASKPDYNAAIKPPVDGAYVWFRRAYPELKTVFAMLTEQRSSRTDIGNKKLFDRLPIIRDLAEAARRWKRSQK